MKIIVVIVTFNRHAHLRRCLDSLKPLYDYSSCSIKVVLNGSDLQSKEIVESHYQKPELIQCFSPQTPAFCRNLALKNEKFDYVFFLDDDAYLPSSYTQYLKTLLSQKNPPSIFGGPDLSPSDASLFARSVGIAQQSPLSTASTRFRHMKIAQPLSEKGIAVSESKLILCNMWVSKSIWEQVGGFDSRFKRNEENIFLEQATKKTDSLFYYSHLFVYHSKKDNPLKLIQAVFKSGFFRVKSALITDVPLPIVYLVPLTFVFYLLFLILTQDLKVIHLIPLISYLILNLSTSCWVCFRNNLLKAIPIVIVIQLTINISYGIGTLWGVFGKLDEKLES